MKKNFIIYILILFIQGINLYSQEITSKDYTLRSCFSNNYIAVQSASGTNLYNSVGENFSLSIINSQNFLLLSGIVPMQLMPVATIYNTPYLDSSQKLLKSPIALPSQCQGSETLLLAEGGGSSIFNGPDSSKGYSWNTGAAANTVQIYPLGDSTVFVRAIWGDSTKNYSFISAPDTVLLSTIKLKANIKVKDLSKVPQNEIIGSSSIDLILVSDSNLSVCQPDEIQYSIKFNRTLFKPISNPTDYTVLNDSIDGDYRIYRIKRNIIIDSVAIGGLISSIKGTVLLGNTEYDSVFFATEDVPLNLQNYTKFYTDGGKTFNIEWFKNGNPYFVDTQVSSGTITLDSLCITPNGKRLLDWPPPAQTYLDIVSISPNPADLSSNILIATNSSSNINLYIYSINGTLVDNSMLKVGPQLFADNQNNQTVELSTSISTRNLSNGAYFILLTSNDTYTSKYLIISR